MKTDLDVRSREREHSVTGGSDATLGFYERQAQAYFDRTVHADMSHLYAPFLSKLPRGGRILDVGCGSGRDVLAFAARGYDVLGVDASAALVALATKHSGVACEVADVRELSFSQEFDGIWACASLLHLAKAELPLALRRLCAALRPSGVLFVALQEGGGEDVQDDGRFLAKYLAPEIEGHLVDAGYEVVKVWRTGDSLQRSNAPSWVNLLAIKTTQGE